MSLNDRFEFFSNAVKKDLENKIKLSEESFNEKKRTAIRKLDEELQLKLRNYYREKIKKAETDSQKKLSDFETENRKKLISLRNSFKEEVYEEAYRLLKEFKGSDEYYICLSEKLREALKKTSNPENSVIRLSSSDLPRLDIGKLKLEKAEFELGGFEIDADNGKGYIDCRFLTALKDGINDFINKLGVVI